MKIKRIHLLIGIPVIVIVILLFVFSGGRTDKTQNRTQTKFKEVEVTKGTFEVIVTANGAVIPIDRIEIKSKASGQIEELPVEEGDFIKAGDLIARLDQKDEHAAVAQTKADLDIADAELKQAERSFKRGNELFDQNLISVEEKDQIELNVAIAKGKHIQAQIIFERAEERLAESIVRAPSDGIILQKYVEKGQIIASGVSNVGGGTPIVDIADLRSVNIESGIDEIDIGKVRTGQIVSVIADAFPQSTFYGKIVRIAPEAKIEQNVTLFDVIVEVENPGGKLKSGMNTTIEITITKEENVLLVPATAIQMPKRDKPGKPTPMALVKTDKGFNPQKVTIGSTNFKQTVVLSGVDEGDILGIPMTSRLKAENDRLENRIKESRSFGTSNRKQ